MHPGPPPSSSPSTCPGAPPPLQLSAPAQGSLTSPSKRHRGCHSAMIGTTTQRCRLRSALTAHSHTPWPETATHFLRELNKATQHSMPRAARDAWPAVTERGRWSAWLVPSRGLPRVLPASPSPRRWLRLRSLSTLPSLASCPPIPHFQERRLLVPRARPTEGLCPSPSL